MARPAALLLTVLTGFTALVYEVAWQRWLAILLGSHAEATAAVLGLFLGGLAAGYAGFGALSHRLVARAHRAGRPLRLLTAYGAVEASVGLYALLFPLFFQLLQRLSIALPVATAGLGFAVDVGLSALLIGPPAVLMGATIPMLTQALARGRDDATRFHALVYASNTLGAFAGALAAAWWLIPTLGLDGVLRVMGGLNLAAGVSLAALDRVGRPVGPALPAAEPAPATRIEGAAALAAVATLCGFAMMALQTVVMRLAGLSLGSSEFTFAMVVAVFVLCIAVGSFAVSAFERIPSRLLLADLWGLVFWLALLYAPLQNAPYWAHVWRSVFRDEAASFDTYQLGTFVGLLALIGPPVLLSGAALPLLFHHLRNQTDTLGDVAGRLYGWNTLGSLLGALLGGYVLLAWLNLDGIYRISVAALALAAALVTRRTLRLGLPTTALVLVPVLLALGSMRAWDPARLASGTFRTRAPTPTTYAGPDAFFAARSDVHVRFYDDDPHASIAVKEAAGADGGVIRSIVTNGKSDGSVPIDVPTMGLAALIPALLADRAERAFVIGFGTGVTAGELASLQSMREVVVAEISRGVLEAAPFFDAANRGASHSPSIRTVRGDAYRVLLRSDGPFDVIVSEPSNPWVTGVEMLYSVEFLTAARERLAPGGVYCQWFHTYETDDATVATVLRTYAAVFPHVSVWYGLGPDLLLLGIEDPQTALDLRRLAGRLRRDDFAAGLARSGVTSLPALLAHELLPLDVLQAMQLEGDVHTLTHPVLSHRSARAFFQGGLGRIPSSAGLLPARVGHEHSLVRLLRAERGGRLSETARGRLVAETCTHRPRECLVLLAEWMREVPVSRARDLTLAGVRRSPLFHENELRELEPLSELFSSGSGDGAPVPATHARHATERFLYYYHHAAPFSRRALGGMWHRCHTTPDEPDPLACATGQADAEQKLGDLDANLMARSGSP